jgi:hypothetical protein
MATRSQTPCGVPKAPLIPVWSLSAPAHESILLMQSTWNGCTRTRRWNASLPANLVMYSCRQCEQLPVPHQTPSPSLKWPSAHKRGICPLPSSSYPHHRCESWGLAHPCRTVTLGTVCSRSADCTLLDLQKESQQTIRNQKAYLTHGLAARRQKNEASQTSAPQTKKTVVKH